MIKDTIVEVDSKQYYLASDKTLIFNPFWNIGVGTKHRRFVERVLGRPLTKDELLGFDPSVLIGLECELEG